MTKKPEIKYVYLNNKLEIVDANREFYVYFEKVGHDLKNLDDFVSASHRNALVQYIRAKNKTEKYKIFKFKKNQSALSPNIVMAYDSFFNGIDTTCLKLIDIEESVQFFRGYRFEDFALRNALSITSDCIFCYWQSSNTIKISQFYQANQEVLVDRDIDEWFENSMNEGLVPESQRELFKNFIEDIKSCPKQLSVSLTCGFRTANANAMEQLSFNGVRFVDDEEIMICGRILAEEDLNRAEHSKKIIEEVSIDPLTKIYNKKTITNKAKKILSRNNGENIALCIIDLDHFKPVNDAYGHMAGDRVLTQTGQILLEVCGDLGIVGRYGGDEFVLVVSGMNSEILLRGFLHSIMIKIHDAFAGRFKDINITCSIGCAVTPKDGDTYDELFKKADFCLYRAKDKGRNRYVFFREDLHKDLYEKAIQEKTGVKYDDREVQELKYMSEFMQEVVRDKDQAISAILNHMLITYNLDNISIYEGEDLKRTLSIGKSSPVCNYAKYAGTEEFKKLLNGQTHFRIDFVANLKDSPLFREEMEDRGIKSTVQCILGTKDKIEGIVSFNRTKESSLWAEYEVNCAALFASTLNLLRTKYEN